MRKISLTSLLILLFLTSLATADRSWKPYNGKLKLSNDNWMQKEGKYSIAYAPQKEIRHIASVANALDNMVLQNQRLTGTQLPGKVQVYFCPPNALAHEQPAFSRRVSFSNFLGLAIGGPGNICLLNLSVPSHGSAPTIYDIKTTTFHEINHIFTEKTFTRYHLPLWFNEALAERSEELQRTSRDRYSLKQLQTNLKGFTLPYSSLGQMVSDRNNPHLMGMNSFKYDAILISYIYFLEKKFGHQAVKKFYQAAKVSNSFDDNFKNAFRQNLDTTTKQWLKFYKMQWGSRQSAPRF